MDKEKYLERIGLSVGDIQPTLRCLSKMQTEHLLHVPFENLDIHWGTEITLDLERFNRKIVENGRGGFCYELNGSFNELLKANGFNTRIISARVSNGEGGYGAEYDHLAIVASLDGTEYLVDVGFGDFSARPLKLEIGSMQKDPNGIYRIIESEENYLEVQKQSSFSWKSEYIFQNLERGLGEFSNMCVHNQTSPESHFTKGKLCSLMTAGGRKTLTDTKFIIKTAGGKTESSVLSEAEFYEILEKEFGISKS